MFATLGRTWQFTKISYGILWDFKQLLIFPILSTMAAVAVLASFAAPLFATGTLEQWLSVLQAESSASTSEQVLMWVTLFLFYFISYFVILFFNTALTACALKVVGGDAPTVGYGMSVAMQRLPQIIGWAFVSAVVGVLLRAIENVNEKAGRWIAAILGSAWTALTYFVVPVLVVEGLGPIAAFKSSVRTLKSTWGEALVGNFSLGLLSFLIMLPVILVVGALGFFAFSAGNMAGIVAAIVFGVVAIMIAAAFTSAADIVFKAILYNYATGKTLPVGVDRSELQQAFVAKG